MLPDAFLLSVFVKFLDAFLYLFHKIPIINNGFKREFDALLLPFCCIDILVSLDISVKEWHTVRGVLMGTLQGLQKYKWRQRYGIFGEVER